MAQQGPIILTITAPEVQNRTCLSAIIKDSNWTRLHVGELGQWSSSSSSVQNFPALHDSSTANMVYRFFFFFFCVWGDYNILLLCTSFFTHIINLLSFDRKIIGFSRRLPDFTGGQKAQTHQWYD